MSPKTTKRRLPVPHTYVLLFTMIVIVAALSWVVPSGTFERAAVTTPGGAEVTAVVPGTFRPVAKITGERDLRQGLIDVLEAPAEGIVRAADVVAFVLVLGGAFGVILRTGAIDRGLHALTDRLAGRGILVIPVMMTLLSLGGSTFGMSEEIIALYPVVIALVFMLGFDSLTAVLILFLGTQAGYIGATLNPFSVSLAQAIAGIHGNPLLWLRAIAWVVFTGLAIACTVWHAHRVRRRPEASPVYHSDLRLAPAFARDETGGPDFPARDRLVLAIFVAALATIGWGLLARGWYMSEIAAVFLACGLACGAVAGMRAGRIAEHFVEGCRDFVYAAFVIGLARGILVVAEEGMIIDPILAGLSGHLADMPTWAFTTLMLLVHNVVTFLVPSSSGEAALTMPVLAPLGDLAGVPRDALVLACHFGNGLTNLVSPTNGILLAGLAIAKIRFGQWLRVIAPFVLLAWPLAALFVVIGAHA